MNTADKNKPIDADILQCKADILRASDIIPPFNRKPQEPQPAKSATKKADSEDTRVVFSKDLQKKSGIPKFDLAEQILAQHRKVTSIKRKSPEQKNEFQQSIRPFNTKTHVGLIPIISSEQERIIAEIVSRDIEHLCSDISCRNPILGPVISDCE